MPKKKAKKKAKKARGALTLMAIENSLHEAKAAGGDKAIVKEVAKHRGHKKYKSILTIAFGLMDRYKERRLIEKSGARQ